jgi:hypothetical protein
MTAGISNVQGLIRPDQLCVITVGKVKNPYVTDNMVQSITELGAHLRNCSTEIFTQPGEAPSDEKLSLRTHFKFAEVFQILGMLSTPPFKDTSLGAVRCSFKFTGRAFVPNYWAANVPQVAGASHGFRSVVRIVKLESECREWEKAVEELNTLMMRTRDRALNASEEEERNRLLARVGERKGFSKDFVEAMNDLAGWKKSKYHFYVTWEPVSCNSGGEVIPAWKYDLWNIVECECVARVIAVATNQGMSFGDPSQITKHTTAAYAAFTANEHTLPGQSISNPSDRILDKMIQVILRVPVPSHLPY